MADELQRIYWDACVPLSYINAVAGRVEIIGKLDPEIESQIDDLWRPGSPITTVEFYDLIGLDARALMRQGIAQGWGVATASRWAFPIREPYVAQMPLSAEG